MSKTEDYLDSLLNAVSDSSAGRVVRKDSRSKPQSYRRENRYTRRQSSSANDRQFLEDFENDILSEDGDDDDFLKEFEMELDGYTREKSEASSDDSLDETDSDFNEPDSEENDPALFALDEDDALEENVAGGGDFDGDNNDLLGEAMKILDDTSDENVSDEGTSEGAEDSVEDLLDIMEDDAPASGSEEPLTEEEKTAGGDDVSAEDAISLEDLAGMEGESDDELPLKDENEENTEELMDLLENSGDGDEDLSEIGDLLKAVDEGETVENDGSDALEQLQDLDALQGLGEPGEDFGDGVVAIEEGADIPDLGDGNKKKEGFLAKLARIIFGDDDEDEELDGAGIAEANGIGELTDENLAILEGLEADAPAADAGNGKKEKKKKEKKPKEKKAKPKKEPKPKKEKKPKPKKEKKPVDPKTLDLSPPLSRVAIVLIFVMGFSFVALVVLFTNLLDSSVTMSEAKKYYKKADYVAAYEELNGKSLKGSDLDFYTKVEILARVQTMYDDYFSLMYSKQYEMAVDSLICAIGRFYVNGEEAASYEVGDEFENLRKLVVEELANIGLTEEEAVEIYNERDRKEYTKAIKRIVSSLGYE
ncbi:MAG: hypothetical protein K6F37_02665 [Lachnospiraceae bacterium]|nr:hypothetical protein [Lachnospiraceae bacterium]